MPSGVSAYIPLANVTLSSSAASVTFSSISQVYRDLVLVVNANTSTDSEFQMRINGDTGGNYNVVQMQGNGSAVSSSAYSGQLQMTLGLIAKPTATNRISHLINFFDYSATDKHKSILNRADVAASGTEAMAFRWASTAAITSFVCISQTGTWAVGSTFALYGVSA